MTMEKKKRKERLHKEMSKILTIAGKEFKDSMRNRWILFATALLAALSLTLTFFGSAPVGQVEASALAITVVSLSSLSIYLIPLIALLLSYDAIVGETERGTLLLLLTYPVSRWQILMGKLVGHILILSVAITVGFGCSAVLSSLLYGVPPIADWAAFGQLILTSIMLGGVFVAVSYLISTFVKERATAAGIGVFIWIFFVLIFDMALIALISHKSEWFEEETLNYIMMLNPTDIYRVINLTGFENVRIFSGLASVTEYLPLDSRQMLAILLLWLAAPFTLAGLFFNKKEL